MEIVEFPVIVIATPAAPPAPWRTGWAVRRSDVADLPGRLHIARAPAGTPLPHPGIDRVVSPGWRPKPTARQADIVRAHYESEAAMGEGPLAELAKRTLAEADALGDETERAIGVPHLYAWYAPLSSTLAQACSAMVRADEQWSSETACGVIRCWLTGYEVWTGVGGHMVRVGAAPSYEAAEARLVEASLARRGEAAERAAKILRGWSPETPYRGGRLADLPTVIRSMPLTIHRGPIRGGGASSDLPIVATWRDGRYERHEVAITWDDDRDRAEMIARRTAGEVRAAERRAAERAKRQ